MPVIPVTLEAEAGELLKLGGRRLQWAEIMLLTALQPEWQSKTLSRKKERQEGKKETTSDLDEIEEEKGQCISGKPKDKDISLLDPEVAT